MLFYRQLLIALLCCASLNLIAQRGLIIQPATSTVMDPNGDGYVSVTTDGFSNDGYYVDEFELQMFGLPVFGDGDALNDTQAGPNCGSTDLTVDSDGVSAYAALDASNNLIFRLRLADDNPSVEAFTILIDTDGQIGAGDPNSTGNNPGFEIDITLINRNTDGIYVYDIDGIDGCPTPVLDYPIDEYFQVSIADEVSCGDEDYFYDFYVPFTDLTNQFGITVDSELQFVVLTNVSATCAMGGKISDVGGVNDDDYSGCVICAFEDLASNQCPVPFSSLLAGGEGFLSGATPTPTMEIPLKAGDALIAGTAEPTAELFVEIFDLNDNLIGEESAVTDADGNWSLNLSAPLVQGDSVTAVAQIAGSCDSGVTGSQLSFAVVVLNTTPVINGTGTALNYTENDGLVSIDDAIVFSDNEDLDLVSATISFSAGFESAEDQLNFTDQNGIIGAYNSSTGVMTLTGDATIEQYTTAAQSVSYSNTSENPVESTRTIEVIINDGTENSLPFSRDIIVSAENDAPVLSGVMGSTEYDAPPPDFNINSTFSISDVDDTQIESASVQIFLSTDDSFVDGDALQFTNQSGITGNYNTSSGILTLTGSASFNDYASALNSIDYEYNPPGSANYDTRRVEFSVSDGDLESAALAHFISFAADVNFPPDVVDENGIPIVDGIDVNTNEDATVEVCLDVTDPDGDLVTIDNITTPTDGAIVQTGNLCFEYTPDPNFNGTESVTVTVCDAVGNCDSTPVDITITVDEVNDAPTLASSTADVNEKATTQICIPASDITDIEGDTHEFTSGTSTNGGTVEVGATGDLCFDYTPPSNFIGTDEVEVTICDSADPTICATNSIFITVQDVNESPIILVDGIESTAMTVDIFEDTVTVFCFAVVDADGDNVNTLSISQLSGTGALIEDATEFCYEFSPSADDTSTSIWQVTIEDDATVPLTNQVDITINIIPVNDYPTLDAINDPIAIDEDAVEQTINLSGITAGGGETQSLIISATSDNPTLLPNPSIIYSSPDATGTLSYTPNPDQYGTATITVTVDDQQSANNVLERQFTVTVNPTNDPPTLDIPSDVAIMEDAVEQSIELQGITAGIGESQTLTVTATSDNTSLINNPSIVYTSPSGTATLLYTPNPDQNGTATIQVTVDDQQASNNTIQQEFSIQVNPVNDSPTLNALSDPGPIDEDADMQTITIDGITAGGGESQTLNITAVSDNPDLIINPSIEYSNPDASGTVSYTPNADQYGTANITVTVDDQETENNLVQQTFTVTVNPVNDPPTLDIPTNLSVLEDAAQQSIELQGITAGMGESQSLTVNAVSNSPDLIGNPTVVYTSPEGSASLLYMPNPDQNGTAIIQVTVDDQQATNNTIQREFSIEVSPVNDTPTLNLPANPAPIDEDADVQAITIDGISAGGGESQNLSISATSDNPDLISDFEIQYANPNTTGSILYAPNADQFGTANITVTVDDQETENNLVQQAFTVTVNPVNDAVTIASQSHDVDERITSQVCINVFDLEDDPNQFVSGSSLTANATIIGSGTGLCFDYTPPVDFIGTDQVEVTVCDVNDPSLCTTSTISINVIDVNDPPIFLDNGIETSNIVINGLEDSPLDLCLEVIDPEGNNVALSSITNLIGEGTIVENADLCFTYTPIENNNGVVTWEVVVCDDGSPTLCTTAFIEIHLENVNDEPIAQADTLFVMRKTPGTINVLANDSDIDNDNLSLALNLAESPSGGTVSMNPNGEITYTSNVTFRGTDQLVYTVHDSGTPTLSTTGSLVIQVGDEPFTVYQTISPNGDDRNDYWHIEGIDFYPDNSVKLYDRSNRLVFEMNGYDNETNRWDGRSNVNGNRLLPEGTYYYRISAGEAGVFGGFVVLRGTSN